MFFFFWVLHLFSIITKFPPCSTISSGCSSCSATSSIVLSALMGWLEEEGMVTRLGTIPFFSLAFSDRSSAVPTSLTRKITSLLLMTFFFTRSHSLYPNSSSPYQMNMQGTDLSSSLVLCSFGTCAKALQPNTFRCE